jgi:hypothetical protein
VYTFISKWIKKFIWPFVLASIVAYFVLTPESSEEKLQSSNKNQIDLFEYNVPLNLRTGKYKEMETYLSGWSIGDMTKTSQQPIFLKTGSNHGVQRVNDDIFVTYQWYKDKAIKKQHFLQLERKEKVLDSKWYENERKEKLMEHTLENRYTAVGETIDLNRIVVSPYGEMPPCSLKAHYDKLNLYDIDIKYPDIQHRKMKDVLSLDVKKRMGNDLIYDDVIMASCDNEMGTITENYFSQSLGLFAVYSYPSSKNGNPHSSLFYVDKKRVSFK